MYITLEIIDSNVCAHALGHYKRVRKANKEGKLPLQKVLDIIDDTDIPTKDLLYQMRSFAGDNVRKFYVNFAVRQAERVAHLAESIPEAKQATEAARTWLGDPTEENARAARAAYAAAYAAAAAAYAAAYAADAARADLRELVIKYYDKEL